jgi:hypothetical protein
VDSSYCTYWAVSGFLVVGSRGHTASESGYSFGIIEEFAADSEG